MSKLTKQAAAFFALGVMVLVLPGCMDSLANQSKKTGSIIGKKTQDIQKFDANAPQQISDSTVRADDPILYGLQAYGPMVEQISKLHIDQAIRLFEAENERYPKDHEEFMTRIIKANNIQLPVLPGGCKYAYDVENHKLEVIKRTEGLRNPNPPGQQPAAGAQAPAAVQAPAGNPPAAPNAAPATP